MIDFQAHSGIYTLTTTQIIPITLNQAWLFFTNPGNLTKLTPKSMGFDITSPLNYQGEIYPGKIITYTIHPFPLMSVNWVTEITQVKEFEYFIDEQRFGPYKMWHHQHSFKETDEGTMIIDNVSYKMPMGIFGKIAHSIFVKKKIIDIFTYRNKILKRLFELKVEIKS